MRRTKQEAEGTRETILAVAERLFLDRGVADVSLEQIAAAAGFTRGAVHWHFQNKHGLLLALLDRMHLPLDQLADRLTIDESLDPLEALAREMAEGLTRLQFDPKRKRLAIYLIDFAGVEAPDRQHQFDRRFRATFLAIFELCEKRGGLAPHWQPAVAALALSGMLSGLIRQWLSGDTEFDLSTDAVAAVSTFLRSLKRVPREGKTKPARGKKSGSDRPS